MTSGSRFRGFMFFWIERYLAAFTGEVSDRNSP